MGVVLPNGYAVIAIRHKDLLWKKIATVMQLPDDGVPSQLSGMTVGENSVRVCSALVFKSREHT
ncbi:MAG: hypothetical protein ACFC1C_03225 [Candidatus Malihini olakiniferum]